MIHHISIPARDTRHVAAVLAELTQGRLYRFPGPLPGAVMVVVDDGNGTMIEVYPERVALAPGENKQPVQFTDDPEPRPRVAFHALISVPLAWQAIEAIGAREGWRAKTFGRGKPGEPPLFHVVEIWVENRVLLEFVPQTSLESYERALGREHLEALGLELEYAATSP